MNLNVNVESTFSEINEPYRGAETESLTVGLAYANAEIESSRFC